MRIYFYIKLQNVVPVYNCLPEIDISEIDTSITIFNKKIKYPFFASAITGGTEISEKVNKHIASVCEELGIPMGLGSQRAMIEKPELKPTFYVRDVAPSILLFANIGAAQLKKYSVKQIMDAVSDVEADALMLHINVAQELFQKEGDANWHGTLENITKLCDASDVPVIAKEVGNGVSRECAKTLKDAGVSGIDVGGFGGTSWVKVDALRSALDFKLFERFGIPTAASVIECRGLGLPIFATGGIRTGLDVAKAIMLGASACGLALPVLRHAMKFESGNFVFYEKTKLKDFFEGLGADLKKAMLLVGARNIKELSGKKYVLLGGLKDWVEQRGLLS